MTRAFYPNRNLKVFVYRNLNKKCWSIKSRGNHGVADVVIAHADRLVLSDCEYKVSQAGRKRVLEQRRKNVHAGVQGNLIWYMHDKEPKELGLFFSWFVQITGEVKDAATVEVTYDPYKYETFINLETNKPIMNSCFAYFEDDGKLYV